VLATRAGLSTFLAGNRPPSGAHLDTEEGRANQEISDLSIQMRINNAESIYISTIFNGSVTITFRYADR